MFNKSLSEFLSNKGYLPFATWSDWGELCFDTNRNSGDNNYPVVLWDHDIPERVKDFNADFLDLLVKQDEEMKKYSLS